MQENLGSGSCTHSYARASPPLVLALAITCFALPLPTTRPIRTIFQAIASPFQSFLTLSEAAALLEEKSTPSKRVVQLKRPLWQTLCLSCLAFGESVAWLGIGSYGLMVLNGKLDCNTILPFLYALAWLPAAIIPVSCPKPTPPYDLFAFYVVQFLITLVHLGELWYKRLPYVLADVIGSGANVLVCMVLTGTVLCMPLSVTSQKDIAEETVINTSPEDSTSLWRWMTFGWIYPLVEKGMYGTLNESDIWELSPLMQSKALYEKLVASPSKSLFRRLLAANSLDLILDVTLTIISVFLNYASPFFLNRILFALSSPSTDNARTLITIYALLTFFSSLCKSEVDMLHLWHARRASTRVRSELMAMIYGKALVRKNFEGVIRTEQIGEGRNAGNADVGKILNLMSGDANRLSMAVAAMHWVYGAPFEIAIATFFLYQLLGLSAFAGLLCVMLASPLNKALAKRTTNIEMNTLTARDKRLDFVTELLNSVKLIKLSGWESHWINRILTVRDQELKWLSMSRINQVLFSAFWACVPIIVSVVSFLAFVLSGHELTIPVAFTAISLFNMVRTPLNGLPDWVTQILRNGVSIKRIEAFLAEDEVPERISNLKRARTSSASPEEEIKFGIRDGTFTWNNLANASDSSSEDGGSRRFELKDINVVFPEGKLTIVTGPTASGKTALLMALLGEMTMLPDPDDTNSGQIYLPKRIHGENHSFAGISYASQSPFLQNQTIRANILFGEPYDDARYTSVLEATALIPDLQEFEKGDETFIGSRGVSLSGGQKARVALARAVYARSRYVLLDDVLSAVDTHTAVYLYRRLISGPLLVDRTVVLVTHNVELVLPTAYYIIYLIDGRISNQGTIESLRQRGVLDKIIKEAATGHSVIASDLKAVNEGKENKIKEDESKPSSSVAQEEMRKVGSIKWSVYKVYLKSSSYLTWIVLAVGIALYQLSSVGEKLWIKQWGEAYEQPSFSNNAVYPHSEHEVHLLGLETFSFHSEAPLLPPADHHPFFYVGIYAAITFGGALISVINAGVEYAGGLRASRVLFTRLLVSVMHATIRWHDTTPTGRMLNRFSKDIESIDTSLGSSIQAMTSSAATLVTSVLVIVIISPLFILPACIIGCLYYVIVTRYLNVARDLRRMEANSRSPIFTDFSDLLTGIVTIRAFSAERRFLNILHQKIDATTKMSYFFWMTSRWLSIRLDVLGAAAVFFTTFLAISIGAGLAGVTITSALAFTSATYWACRNWTQLELDLNSVERLIEYLELPQEPPQIIDNAKPPAYWPSNSNNDVLIDVHGLTIRHSPDLPTVLHDVSFTLRPRERVGIVGRTGSGKSTLAMSLLRFTEPLSGTIRVDGIDISTIGLHDLRSRITFVAQDSILFSGTIRSNIDPFGDYTDAECLNALARVHLLGDTSIENNISKATKIDDITLDTEVSVGGLNFSQGQRQLLSLARALLRQSSIIILDEATSSIDYETDIKIQTTIREEFENSLLLTIAHRLRTVIDYDRLIVLDKGHVVEFDTPYNLVQKEGGVFHDMCIHSENFEELKNLAAKGHGRCY